MASVFCSFLNLNLVWLSCLVNKSHVELQRIADSPRLFRQSIEKVAIVYRQKPFDEKIANCWCAKKKYRPNGTEDY